jgi:T5SS/PEP-CTERM-associated repeat protein
MKKLMIMMCAGVLGALSAQATYNYSFLAGETVGYWDDAARWTNDDQAHILPPHWVDAVLAESGTLYVTNTQPAATADNANPWLYAFWLRTPQTNPNPGVLHLTTNAHLKAVELGCASEAGQAGIIQIDAGAFAEVGSLEVGRSGSGIVTNQGTISHSEQIWIGRYAGSSGRLVHCDGATMENANPKDLYVGQQGHGELLVRDATFDWYWWSDSGLPGSGAIVVGESSAGGVITLESVTTNAILKSYVTYLGGRDAGAAGVGELRLRGGEFYNQYENKAENTAAGLIDNFRIGMCPTAEGGVDTASRGTVLGWGRFRAENPWQDGVYGIHAAMGYGEIVGDGEGDESRVLESYTALYSVSNALPADVAAETTSGWRAVNKGMVTLPAGPCEWDGGTWDNLVAYPGCAKEKGVDNLLPDLVNAVRIRASGTTAGQNKCFGVAVLAPDRTDAYTNALPANCNVLSVHKMGVFNSVTTRTADGKGKVGTANVAIRYDQTKILKPNTRLELWRYVVADGKWTRLVRLNPGERPEGKVIAMADDATITSVDEVYNLGTFAVVEREPRGMVFVVR